MSDSGTATVRTRRVGTGWRSRAWPLILVVLCVTALQQVELSLGDVGSCNPDNTCAISTLCCSINKFCGDDSSYCGAGNCTGGPCWSTDGEKKSVGKAVGISVGSVAGVVLLGVIIIVFVARRRAQDKEKGVRILSKDLDGNVLKSRPDSRHLSAVATKILQTLSVDSFELRNRLPYETLHCATNGFKVELGRGSFGVVYKGTLFDGTDIAVKHLLDGERKVKDFEAEVKTLGRINHANLVALLGCTIFDNKYFLVYEFVANGSLDQWIFRNNRDFVLPWKTRVDILKGTAKGLAYLHEELQRGQTIVHLDIKPANILLTNDFTAKIADFGLAKLLGSAATKQTLAAGGTRGYMAPEIYVGAVSDKMDVYSFGMVMLEVVSGRENEDPHQPPETLFLPAWAMRKVLMGEQKDVVDELFEEGELDPDEAERLIWVALLCLQEDPSERPGMSTVLRMMDGIQDPPDLPPTLLVELERAEKLIRKLA